MRWSWIRSLAPLAAWMGCGALACGSGELDGATAFDEGMEERHAQPELRAEDALAREALAELAARHASAFSRSARSLSDVHAWLAPTSSNGGRAARFEPPRFEPELARWVARGGRGARAWSASFPELADEPLELGDDTSELAVRVQVRGAASVAGGQAGEFLVYPNGHGPGTTLLYRVAEHGFEDYVAFEQRPREAAISYELTLSREVAGLRLVARTLELLDERGAPRLRVSPPYLIDADGRRVRAELDVLGCDVDADAAAPWERSPVPPGASRCELRISWDDAALRYPAVMDPAWGPAGSMAAARQRFAALLLPSGRALVAGGLSGTPAAAVESAELYDPATDTWAATGPLLLARSEHALTLREGGGVLASGGRDAGGEVLASVERYDASLGVFVEAAPLPEPRAGHRAVSMSNGDVLVAGGLGSSRAARLRRGATSWEEAGSTGAEQPGASLTALSAGRALLVGPNPPGAQLFDSGTGDWRATGAPAVSRSGHTATRLADGQVLLAGGTEELGVEIYEPRSERFRAAGALSELHVGHSATLLPDGHVVLVGGVGAATGTEIFNPLWSTWAAGPAPIERRAWHEAVLLPDGRLLMAGGVAAGAAGGGSGPRDAALALASSEALDARLTPTKISEYKFQATLDRDVSSVVTELWAAVARPSVLERGRRYPLILFLHGNHATCGTGQNPRQDIDCTYTEEGVCPAGFVVAPSHRGYDYVTSELAARGYIVVSVNANRGINCGGGDGEDFSMNIARGRLLLKHLERLSEWHRGAAPTPASIGVSLQGALDFSQVGIMGHSRGGEGARAAYEELRDPGSPWPARIALAVDIRAIFEIGPVDGQTPRVFNADGVAWNVLLPMCDGDVADLQGVKPFDRMLGSSSEARDSFKATYAAWGTNHNYFNTEWQESDSPGCTNHQALFASGPGITGSAEQRQIALRSLLAFFLGSVGAEAEPEQTTAFDPLHPVDFHSRIDRGYTPGLGSARALTLENFSAPSGLGMSLVPTVARNVLVSHGSLPEHDPALRGAFIRWNTPSTERFFELRFTEDEADLDLSAYDVLEFRIDRSIAGRNPVAPTAVLVQLLSPDGALSEGIDLSERGVVLDGPVGGPFSLHSMLQTVRLPFADFPGASATAVSGVRFSFSDALGALNLASVRASVGVTAPPPVADAVLAAAARAHPGAQRQTRSAVIPGAGPALSPIVTASGNRVLALRLAPDQRVEIELGAQHAFQARDALLELDLGGKAKTARSYHPRGDLRRVVFSLDPALYAAAASGDALTVQYKGSGQLEWRFGPLDKSMLVAPGSAPP